eukprot:1183998-Rhodomonas_salina.2
MRVREIFVTSPSLHTGPTLVCNRCQTAAAAPGGRGKNHFSTGRRAASPKKDRGDSTSLN